MFGENSNNNARKVLITGREYLDNASEGIICTRTHLILASCSKTLCRLSWSLGFSSKVNNDAMRGPEGTSCRSKSRESYFFRSFSHEYGDYFTTIRAAALKEGNLQIKPRRIRLRVCNQRLPKHYSSKGRIKVQSLLQCIHHDILRQVLAVVGEESVVC